jgi:hypothetical protein
MCDGDRSDQPAFDFAASRRISCELGDVHCYGYAVVCLDPQGRGCASAEPLASMLTTLVFEEYDRMMVVLEQFDS